MCTKPHCRGRHNKHLVPKKILNYCVLKMSVSVSLPVFDQFILLAYHSRLLNLEKKKKKKKEKWNSIRICSFWPQKYFLQWNTGYCYLQTSVVTITIFIMLFYRLLINKNLAFSNRTDLAIATFLTDNARCSYVKNICSDLLML